MLLQVFRDAATRVLQCARLVAPGSDAEDYRDFNVTYAAVLAADDKASGLCRIGLLLSIARRGQELRSRAARA
jgi:hypothetical protein